MGIVIATAHAEPVSLRSGATFIHEGLTVRAWSTAEGLPQATVSDIAQTEDGFLWMSTFAGLARFDGHSFKTFGMAPSMGGPTLRLSDVSPASNGELWLGLERGGVLRFDGTTYSSPEQPPELKEAAVIEVLELDEALWVAGTFGVMARRDGVWSSLPGEGFGAGAPSINDLDICPDGSVWVAAEEGLGRLDGGRLVRVGEPATAVTCHDGAVYAGSDRGVELWDGEGWQVHLEPGRVVVLAHGPEGALWAGGHGFIQRLGPSPQRWALSGTIESLVADREGNFWAGTHRSGLIRLSEQPFERLDDMLNPSNITGPVLSYGSDLLVAQPDNALMQVRRTGNGDWVAIDQWEAFYEVTALGDGPSGPLVGTKTGAYTLDGELLLAPAGHVMAITGDATGDVWVGVQLDGLYRLSGDDVTHLTTADGLLEDNIRSIVIAPNGDLWLAHERGVTVLRDGFVLRTLGPEEGVPPGQIRAIWFDPEGRAWLGSYGGGLGLVEPALVEGLEGMRGVAGIRRFTSEHGLYDDVISVIVDDGAGALWMNGNRGVFRLQYDELARLAAGELARVHSWPFPTGEGHGVYLPSATTLRDGRIAFAMVDGVVLMDPARAAHEHARPPIHVEGVSADGVSIPQGGEIPAGTQEIVIPYTSPSLTWPSLVRYQTRLVERDMGWSTPTTDRQLRFLRLEPGAYTLQVRAINEHGAVSAVPAQVTFTQAPFWWQTRLTRALIGLELVGLGLLIGAVGWRRARRRASVLQEQIDHREHAEAEQKALSEQLHHARRLETVGRLAGGIAHDFNNLLTVVVANAELAQGELDALQVDVEENLNGILDASQRGSELVRQLLAFSRQQVLEPRRYELNQSLHALKPMIKRFTRELITLTLRPSETPLEIFADPGQIDLVVLNLCINAVDAMPDGGALTLAIRRDNDDALLTVTDTGGGISDADLPRIFDPFFTTKPLGTGTGLGLSSALGTINQSGGDLQVESTPGEGTAFTIRLPLTQAPPELMPQERANAVILLCDDNPYVRRACAKTMRSGGYEVVVVESPEAALLHLRERSVDALVTDVLMPGMDGPQLVARARAIQRDLRALYISGHARELRQRLAGERCLQKPFQPGELLSQLKELLQD